MARPRRHERPSLFLSYPPPRPSPPPTTSPFVSSISSRLGPTTSIRLASPSSPSFALSLSLSLSFSRLSYHRSFSLSFYLKAPSFSVLSPLWCYLALVEARPLGNEYPPILSFHVFLFLPRHPLLLLPAAFLPAGLLFSSLCYFQAFEFAHRRIVEVYPAESNARRRSRMDSRDSELVAFRIY